MGLPQAIQQQAETADRIAEELHASMPASYAETSPGATVPEPGPPPVEPPPAAEPPVAAPVPEETWERKFISLQGKYDAEVPRLYQQVRDLSTQLQTVLAKHDTPPPRAPDPAPATSLITDSDREAFGSDLLDVIDRATKQNMQTFAVREQRMLDEIAQLKGQLGSVNDKVVVSDKDRFFQKLTQHVPDWEQVNVDQGFLSWLAETDPVYGMVRQAGLQQAFDMLDVDRVGKIFQVYKQRARPAPAATPRQELSSHVAPTRSRVAPAPAASSAEGRIWTQAQITDFYNDCCRGHIDAAEAARIEHDINAAVVEGRVR